MNFADVVKRLDAYDGAGSSGKWMTGYIVAMFDAEIISEDESDKLIQDYVILNREED